MSITTPPALPRVFTPSIGDEPVNFEKLQQESIDALEIEASGMEPDRFQHFMASVRQYAGDILKFLDHLEAHGALPFDLGKTARSLFSELRTLGSQFVISTETNQVQVSRELSAFETFKNFRIKPKDLSPFEEYHIPTFSEIMTRAQQDISESNLRQNIALAEMLAGGIRWGGDVLMEAAKIGLCNMTPVNVQMCRTLEKVGESVPVKKALKIVSEEVQALLPDNQALSDELNRQFEIPHEVGKKYGEDALVVGLNMLPLPPVVKWVGRPMPNMRLVSRFLKEDSGALKLSLPLSGEAFETLETSFQHIQSKIKEITRTHPSSTQFSSVLDLTFHCERDLLPLIPDLSTFLSRATSLDEFSILTKKYLGRTPDTVSFFQNGNGKKTYLVSFPETTYYAFKGDYLEIINSFLGMRKMGSLELAYSEVPKPLAFGRNGEVCYLILTDLGETLAELLHGPKVLTQLENLGRALGELHGKNMTVVNPGSPMHHELIRGQINIMQTLRDRILDGKIRLSESRYEALNNKLNQKIRQLPLTAGFIHGDAHLKNITWNPKTQKIGFIDVEFVMRHITLENQSKGFQVAEYFDVIDDLMERGLEAKIPRNNLDEMVASYKKGYKSVYPIENPEIEKLLEKVIESSYPRH